MNIIGRLTKDAEIRNLPNQRQVVNFSIATNETYRNKEGEQIHQTTYFDCSYWISSKVAELLTKGTLVELSGRVYTRAWIGKGGEPHAGLNFHTSLIKLHSTSKKNNRQVQNEEALKSGQNKTDRDKDDDLPF